MKRWFKNFFIQSGYSSGLFEFVRRRSARQGQVPILLYHRILKDAPSLSRDSIFTLLGLGVKEAAFAQQLAYVQERYQVISLKEYLVRKGRGDDLAHCAVVTFDDGLRDVGASILEKYKIPATVFLIGDTFQKFFWRHQLFSLLDDAAVGQCCVTLSRGEKCELSLTTAPERYQTLAMLSKECQSLSDEQRDEFFVQLKRVLGITKDYQLQDVYLTREDITHLSAQGIDFGSHSMSHRDLSKLSEEEILQEIACSRESVQALVSGGPVAFSIPFGKYDARVIAALKRSGIPGNLTSDSGLNSATQDRYLLKRIFVNTDSLAEFVYKISGVESWCGEQFLKIHNSLEGKR